MDGGTRRLLGPAGTLVFAAGFAAALTSAYIGMRDVIRTSGGFCASGGPYVIAHHCASGQTKALTFGMLGLFVLGGGYAGFTAWVEGPLLGAALLMWAAIFGALGWNFVYPPHGRSGYMATGVVFWAMALGGLVPALLLALGWLRRRGDPEPAPAPAAPTRPLVRAAVMPTPAGGGPLAAGADPFFGAIPAVASRAADAGAAHLVAWRIAWLVTTAVGVPVGILAGKALADSLIK